MSNEVERNLGPQPIAQLLDQYQLNAHDLVAASQEQITHKMVTKGSKGRRLSTNVQMKILRALNLAASKSHVVGDLFSY